MIHTSLISLIEHLESLPVNGLAPPAGAAGYRIEKQTLTQNKDGSGGIIMNTLD